MRTEVQDNSLAQLETTYSAGIDSEFPPSNEPMTPEETTEFLSQLNRKIVHPVLQSTRYDPKLEERIL